MRHLLTQDADAFTGVDRSLWYDLIEELRRAPGKTGDRSNFVGDRGKNSGAGAASAASPAKS